MPSTLCMLSSAPGATRYNCSCPNLAIPHPHNQAPNAVHTPTLSSQEAFTELVAHLTRNPDAELPLATRKGNVTAAQVVALLEPVGGGTLPNPTAGLVLTVVTHTNHRWPRTCMFLLVPRVFPSTSLMPQLPLAAPAVVARMWTALLLRVARCHLTASGTQRHPLVPSSSQQMATPQLLLRKLQRARRSKHSPRFGSTHEHTHRMLLAYVDTRGLRPSRPRTAVGCRLGSTGSLLYSCKDSVRVWCAAMPTCPRAPHW